LAGDLSDDTYIERKIIAEADQWARGMRQWMQERGTWKDATDSYAEDAYDAPDCGKCGARMDEVRPGKYQCSECE
jgi:hypothetical protein